MARSQNFSFLYCSSNSCLQSSVKASLQPHRRPTFPTMPLPSQSNFNASPPSETSRLFSLPHNDQIPTASHSMGPVSLIAKYCCPFLLDNLHDPYPTSSQKQNIVNQANASEVTLTSVSTWFSNSRRRCGWVDICNDVCGGDTRVMTDLCAKVFRAQDLKSVSDGLWEPAKGAVNRILAMREKVKGWYEEQVKPSDWALALHDLLQQFSDMDLQRLDKALADSSSPRSSSSGKTKKTGKVRTLPPNEESESQTEDFEYTPSITSKSSISDLDSPDTLDYSFTVPDPNPLAGRKRLWVEYEEDNDKETEITRPSRCISMSSMFSESSDSALSVESLPSLIWSTDDETRSSKRFRSEDPNIVACSHEENSSPPNDALSEFLEFPFTFTHADPELIWDTTFVPVEQSTKRARVQEDEEEGPSIKRIKLLDTVEPLSVSVSDFNWLFNLPQEDASFSALPAQLSGPTENAQDPPTSAEANGTEPFDTTPSFDLEFFNWDSYNLTNAVSDSTFTELLANLTHPDSVTEKLLHDSSNNIPFTNPGATETPCHRNQESVKENDAGYKLFDIGSWEQSEPADERPAILDKSNSTCGLPERNIPLACTPKNTEDA